MATNGFMIAVVLFICLSAQASSQGYMGTVTTGTGIVPPLTVGKSIYSTANVGASSSLANLTGSWSIDLKGTRIEHLDLQMFQKRDMIMGWGKMDTGGASLPVVAAGSMKGNGETIFISQIDNSEVLRLALSSSGTALAGEYESLSASGVSESGTMTGNIVLAPKQNQSNALGKGTNPSTTFGARVGKANQSQNDESYTGHFNEKKSIYKSSTGQGTITLDGTEVTTSYV
jgi:hypothetical protein